jgi:hypothetical protein
MSSATGKTHRLRAIATSKPALIGVVALLIYALAGFVGAPWLVRQQLPKLVEEHLGAKATIGDVRINPFLFKVELDELSISEKNGLPAFQLGKLLVDFETSSLLRWALTFREIRIEKPLVNADLDANESLNFARLLAAIKTEPDQDSDGKLPRLLVDHFEIAGGVFKFTDHTLQPAATSTVNPINFEIRDVSTLPDHSGEHRLNARLPGGGELQWQGKLSLSPIASSGSISLKDARLSTLWQFVRDHLTIAEPQGSYHFGVRYQFGYSGGALKFEADDLAFGLKDLVIAQEKGGTVLAKLGTIAFEGGSFNLAQRSIAFKDIRVADGGLGIILDEDSIPDWAKLVRNNPKPVKADADDKTPAKDAERTKAAPWAISLPQINIGPLALSLTDYSRPSSKTARSN